MSQVFTPLIVMTMPPRWVVDAYLAALSRVRAAEDSGEEAAATAELITIGLTEALMWVDTLRTTNRKMGRGQELSKIVAADPVVQALAFARARAHHHWASIVTQGESPRRWVWNSADVLPPAPDRYADQDGEALYRQLLQGRPVVEALETVAGLLGDVERP
jgi:hypothetical protein